MKIVLIKKYPNVGGRMLAPGQIGEWANKIAKELIKEGIAVEYNAAIHSPFQTGGFINLEGMKKATNTPIKNKTKVSNPKK